MAAAAAALVAQAVAPGRVEILKPTGGLPASIQARLALPVSCAQTRAGEYLVLDRRAHTVYAINAPRTNARRVVQIGSEKGRLLQPAAMSVSANDIIAVADAPAGYERIQLFSPSGSSLGAFVLEKKIAARLSLGPIVLNGIGSMAFTGTTFVLSRPEAGALIAELDIEGNGLRQFGALRRTGHEADRDLHLAFNIGLPLVDPTGGFFFVFQTGRPMFRKYDAAGALMFERHIEGVELDAEIQTQPTSWPRRETEGGTFPLVLPVVRTAAVDPSGRLWVSLMAPVTYVYDRRGDKVRTIEFDTGAPISPSSFFFTKDDRLLITPGCYEFRVTPPVAEGL
jgi:hypothetical protein